MGAHVIIVARFVDFAAQIANLATQANHIHLTRRAAQHQRLRHVEFCLHQRKGLLQIADGLDKILPPRLIELRFARHQFGMLQDIGAELQRRVAELGL